MTDRLSSESTDGPGLWGEPGKVRPQIPDHELLRPIGAGSYGDVWLARNVMGTLRAVKVVYRRTFESERPYEREFSGIQKFEPISRSHQGFVDILQVGRNDPAGYFYYVMELADPVEAGAGTKGSNPSQAAPESLALNGYSPKTLRSEVRRRGRLPTEECLQLSLSLTSALGQLHKQGLVHRDIKPSNIIFVNGQPKLADIGLVASVTDARSFVGTEGFIPLEGPGTPQADLYSLGKVLYEISTGKDRTDFPELPTLVRALPERARLMEFNEVVLKACQNDCAKRYGSAEEMLADLALLQSGKSIQHMRRVERRLASITKIGVAAVLVAALTVGVYLAREARHLEMERLLELAKSSENKAREKLWEAYVAEARATRWSGRAGRRLESLRVLGEAARLRPDRSLRDEAIASLALSDMHPRQTWDAFPPGTAGVAFGHQLERYARSDPKGNLSVRRVSDDSELAFFPGQGDALWVLRFSPNDQYLAVKNEGGGFRVWDLAARGELLSDAHGVAGTSLRFSPDGRTLAVGGRGGAIRFYDVVSGQQMRTLTTGATPNDLVFDPTGAYLAVSSPKAPQVQILSLGSGQAVAKLFHPAEVAGLAWRDDGQLLACACSDQNIYLWSAKEPFSGARTNAFAVLPGHQAQVRDVTFSHDGSLLVSFGWDTIVRLWDVVGRRQILALPAYAGDGVLGTFDAEDLAFIFRSSGSRATLCEVATQREYRTLQSDESGLGPSDATLSPDGRLLASAHHDGIRLWSPTSARLLSTISNEPTRSVTFDAAGHGLFACADDHLGRWNVNWERSLTGTVLRVSAPSPPLVQAMNENLRWACLSADGGAVAVVGEHPDTVVIRDLRRQTPALELRGHPSAHFVTASADGRWIASYQWPDRATRVSDLRSGKIVFTLKGTASKPAFSSDSKWLLTGTSDQYTLFRTESWEAERRIPKDPGGNTPVTAFSHDGRILAIEYSKQSLKLLDIAKNFEEIASLEPPDLSSFSTLAFSPDDSMLVSAAVDHRIHLWDLRLIRQRLAAMHLDWDLPPLPPAAESRELEQPVTTIVEPAPWLQDNFRVPGMASLVPPRDPAAGPNLIDLTEHYNTQLYKAWWTAELPFGVQTLGGVPFDIRGQITVASRHDYQLTDFFPGRRYTGIPVRQKFHLLHFLQGASFRSPDGRETGRYIVHYADGRKVKVPLVYGQTTLDFNAASDARELGRTPLVWSGSKVKGVLPRLFKFSWENPFPDVEVASLDFETTMTESAPWVIAITAEP